MNKPTHQAETNAIPQMIAAKINQPLSSPVEVALAEKKITAGITRIPTKPPPTVEPTRA